MLRIIRSHHDTTQRIGSDSDSDTTELCAAEKAMFFSPTPNCAVDFIHTLRPIPLAASASRATSQRTERAMRQRSLARRAIPPCIER